MICVAPPRPSRSSCRVFARSVDHVELTLLKLVLTPSLTAFATVLGRRFGQRFAGWLIGFPFTSAPISLFLAVEHGTDFAAAAAVGSITAAIACAAFALTFARAAPRGWPVALGLATAAFALVGVALRAVAVTPIVLTSAAWVAFALGARAMPARRRSDVVAPAPRWDLPARMLVATALVLALTTAAPLLGPFTSGLLAGFPLYATVLGVFAHRGAGPAGSVEVMRGLTAGLFGFAAFFLVIATMLGGLGLVAAFLLAVLVVVTVQGVSFVLLRRSS